MIENTGKWLGLPYKGEVYDYKSTDPPELLPQLKGKIGVEVLDMSNKDDVEKYKSICQQITDGMALLSFEERKFQESTGCWKVFLRYIEQFYIAPEGIEDVKEKK